ncbi:MAG: alpha/beta hydrolase [Rubellimicrobium sp.]|nr:alpha/beta hydrolase [Rubellimicrobium sp.]
MTATFPSARPAPFFDDVADGPEGAVAHFLITSDGLRIRTALWPRADATGTVLIFPGRTEFVEKYGRTARELARLGFASMAVDWRGQGIAARLLPNPTLGHVWRFSDYQHDVAALVAQAQALDLPRPWFLLAHSMGGCIGLRALIEGLPVAAAAFTGPMWGIRIGPAMRPVAWSLSALARQVRMGHLLTPGQQAETYLIRAPFEGNDLTTDPEMFRHMQRQLQTHPDLALGGPSLQWLFEALSEMRRLRRLPAPAVPALTILGTREEIVDIAPIGQRMVTWPGSRMIVIDHARHEVLMETPAIRARVHRDIAAFFVEAAG